MKYAWYKTSIHCDFKTKQCGHLIQTEELSTLNDTLDARFLYLNDDHNALLSISLDCLSIPFEFYNRIEPKLKSILGNTCNVLLSATHTHYGHDMSNDSYLKYLENVLINAVKSLEIKQCKQIEYSIKQIHCQDVGKSRISGYETNNEILTLLQLYVDQRTWTNMIIYNVHPTILHATVPFFSSEFIGYTLNQLSIMYPSENFTYYSGACGDISSRFTRNDQTYDSVISLGNKFTHTILSLHDKSSDKCRLSLSINQYHYPLDLDYSPIDVSKIRDNLTSRELETIQYGQIMRKKALAHPESVPHHLNLSQISFGDYMLLFVSHEIFSDYLNAIDTTKSMIISYTNGFGPYILPKDFPYITYETFMDATTNKTKDNLKHDLHRLSTGEHLQIN